MLKYEYMDKEWVASPTARRVYRALSLIAGIFFGWCAVLVMGVPQTLPPIVRLLLLADVLGVRVSGHYALGQCPRRRDHSACSLCPIESLQTLVKPDG